MTNIYSPMTDRRSNRRSSFAASLSYLLLLPLFLLFMSNAQGQTVITVGSVTGTAPSVGTNPGSGVEACSPYGGNVSSGACGKKWQAVYTPTMINAAMTAAGFSPGSAFISTVGFNISAVVTGSGPALSNYTVKMANVAQADLSGGYLTPTFTTVFGPATHTPTATGFFSLTIASPFLWDGTSNLCVEVCYNMTLPGFIASYGGCRYTAVGGNNHMGFAGGASGSCSTVLPGTGSLTNRLCDMRLTVSPGTPCSGAPATGTASSATPCAGTSSTLSISGLVGGSGYTYQWLNSNAIGGTYATIGGATSSTYATPTTLPYSTTYYKCDVTCSNSGQTTRTNAGTVTNADFLLCYCITNFTSAAATTARGLTLVNLVGNSVTINNTTAANTASPSPYTLYSTPVADLSIGAPYTLKTTVGTATNNLHYVAAWIDYDHDGLFGGYTNLGAPSSTSDFNTLGTNEKIAIGGPTANVQTTHAAFTVPATSLTGNTAMRVRYRYGASMSGIGGCTTITGSATAGGAGEVEDYRVFISGGCTAPTVNATGFVGDPSFPNTTTTSTTVKFNRGNGDAGMLVVVKAGSAPQGPAPGTPYSSPNANITGGGDITAAGSFVIYNSNAGATGNPGDQMSVLASGLTPGTTYYFAAYEWNAASNCYQLTNPEDGSVFIPLCIQPTLGVTGVTVPTINTTSVNMTWSAGNGNKTLIVIKEGTAVTGAPALTTGYTAISNYNFGSPSGSPVGNGNAVFGSNGADNATSATITGLFPSKTYHYAVYSYFSATNCYYLAAVQTGNFTTASCSPATDATSLTTSNITNNAATLTFVRGDGSNVMVVARLTATARVFPVYNSSYSANTAFGSGATTGAGNFVVLNGTAFTVNITGLSAVTSYTFDVYEYDATPNCYSTTPATVAFTTLDPTTSGGCAASVVRTTGAGQYTSISPATVLNSTGQTNGYYQGGAVNTPGAGLPIGFNFVYDGNTYTSFGLSTNGYIWFGSGVPLPTATNPISNASPNLGGSGTISGIIAAAGTFVSNIQHYNTGRSIGYSVTGVTPNRVLTVQWKGYSLSNSLGSCYLASHYDGNRLDFQIQLNENGGTNSNKIILAYQDMNPYCVNANTCSAQVGLRGTSNASFTNRTGNANANWANTAGTVNTDVCSMGASNYLNGNVRLTYTQAATVGPTFSVGALDCPAGTVPLTAQAGYSSYQWFKDGSVVPGPGSSSQVLNATVSGNYTVVGKTGTCYLQSISTPVTVGSCATCVGTPPSGTVSLNSGASSYCVSGSSSLTLTGLGVGSYDYEWESAPDISGSPGTYVPISGATELIYNTGSVSSSTWFRCNVTCVASSETTTSDEFKITINPLPTVTATPPSITICNGANTGLVAGGASTYSWSPVTGLSPNTGSSVTATRTTSVTYTVTGTDANGCTASATSQVLVDNTATTVTPNAPFIALGSSAGMTAFHPTAASYAWTGSTLDVNVGASVVASPTITTNYNVTATDVNGCPHTTAVKVTVNLGLPGNVSCGYSWSKPADAAFALLSSPTQLASGVGSSTDDALYPDQNIGFPFDFNGITYSSLGVSTNGFVWFGATNPAATEYNPISTTAGLEGVISVFGANLKGATVTSGCLGFLSPSTSLNTKLTGSSPNQVFTIEWRSFKFAASSSVCSVGDYQIMLYENGHKIEFHYNNNAYFINDSYAGEVGIRGSSNSSFNNRSITCSAGSNWDTPGGRAYNPGVSAAGAVNTATCSIDGASSIPFTCNLYPETNMVWRWTPTLTTPTTTPAGTNDLCLNADFSYAGNNTNPSPTYQWLRGGVNTVTTVNYTANESVLGNYYYSFKVTSGGCSRNSYVTTGVVNPLPATPGGLSNQTRCDNGAVTFTATLPIPVTGLEIQWSDNGTTVAATGLSYSPNITVAASPVNFFARVHRPATGCVSAWVAVTGIANPLPVVSTADASPASVCLKDVSTLTATGDAASYYWKPATYLFGIDGAPSVFAAPPVTTTYTVTGVSAFGCSSVPATTVLTIKPLPTLIATPQSAVCTGQITATLGATTDAPNYTWSPNLFLSPTSQSLSNNSITVEISQLTFYTVTATAANGCTDSREVPVATVSAGGLVNPVLSIVCSPPTGVAKTLVVSQAAGNSYQWQSSTDGISWPDVLNTGDPRNISGATNKSYNAHPAVKTYYRLIAKSDACWNVASSTAQVDVSNPTLTVTAPVITDKKITLDWTPVGTGNYNINWGGTSSGSVSAASPRKTIPENPFDLVANGSYNVTVSQTGLGLGACPASGTLSGIQTLCAAPVITSTNSSAHAFTLNWTGGAGSYRIYYRLLFTSTSYATKDVVAGASPTAIVDKTGNNVLSSSATYEVYIVKMGCGVLNSQPSDKSYIKTTPTPACAAPGVPFVRSLCPTQIEVFLTNAPASPSNSYVVYVQRLTPTVTAVGSYQITAAQTANTPYLSVNVGTPGENYLVAVASKCPSGLSELVLVPGGITVKPVCASPNNLVISKIGCGGFTSSWNSDPCGLNNVNYYNIYMRRTAPTVGGWSSYKVLPPPSPISPYFTIGGLNRGITTEVYVRSVYNCSGFITLGPQSNIQSVTTKTTGCRDEEDNIIPENDPSVQVVSSGDEVISLYPNPNSGQFLIDISRLNTSEEQVKIEVMNLMGQTVVNHFSSVSNGQMSEFINLPESVASGTYFVRVIVGNNVYTTKVSISK